jgi:cell division protein FtsQ
VSTLGRIPRAVAVVPRTVVGLPRAAVALPRAALGLPRFVARLPRAVVPGPHGRRRLVALAVVAAVLAAGYTFWLRDSSFVRVEHVSVSGLDRADAARIHAKLALAARRMTTLHVDPAALRRAVADEPIVKSLAVDTDFPHGLKITIVQNRPVAMLVAGGREVAVAPDGTLLEGAKVSGSLPIVRLGALPGNGHLPDGPARERVFVAAAAPPRLLAHLESISIEHGRGAVAQLSDGPVIIFGRAIALRRKWLAAAAVLAQRSSQGATFIDVRMPERPVAGGLGVELDPQPQAEALAAGAEPTVPGADGTATATGAATTAGPGVAAPSTVQTAPQSQAATPQTQVAPAPAAAATPSTGAPPAGSTQPSTTSTEPQP